MTEDRRRKTEGRGRKTADGLRPKGEVRRAAVQQVLGKAHDRCTPRAARGMPSQRRATRAGRRKTAPPRPALLASRGPRRGPRDPSRRCGACVYASRVHGDPPRTLVCVNHPDRPGELTRVKPCRGCPNFRKRYEPPRRREPPDPPNPHVRYLALTKGKFTLVDAEDYDRLMRHKWTACFAGGKCYAGRTGKGKCVLMHREIMNTPKGMVVDHIGGEGLINCKFNLRNCTSSQNNRNRRPGSKTSRYKGVCWDKERRKWRGRVRMDGRDVCVGRYDDEVEAARVRDCRAVEIAGRYTWLNFPEEWPAERIRAVHEAAQAGRLRDRKPARKAPAVRSNKR